MGKLNDQGCNLYNHQIVKKMHDKKDKWRLMERIFLCSLEIGQKDISAKLMDMFIAKFGATSKRVKVLRGMEFESDDQKIEKASKLYTHVLGEDGNHMLSMK